MDLARNLRKAVDTGRVVFGVKETTRAMKSGKAKLVVISRDCPDEDLHALGPDKVHEFPGTNAELGAACGKPFFISALAVIEPGESNILSA